MPEEIRYDSDLGLIRIHSYGDDPIETWIASRAEVLRLHQLQGAKRLLVNARELVSAPSVLDIFDFGDNWPKEIRVGIVISSKTPDDVMFLESAATYRGKSIRIFFDEDDAMTWLMEEAVEPSD